MSENIQQLPIRIDQTKQPDLVVTLERWPNGKFSASAVCRGAEYGFGLGDGDLGGALSFAREHLEDRS